MIGGTHTLIVLGLALALTQAAVVPNDDSLSSLLAGGDDQMADALTETIPSMADPAVREKMVGLAEKAVTVMSGGSDPVPVAIIGTDDGVADVLGGVKAMAASVVGAVGEVAGETMDQMADALTETLPSMADPAVREKMVGLAEKAVTVIDAAKETFDKALEAAAPEVAATPLLNPEVPAVVDDAWDDVTLPGVPVDDMFDDGAPSVAKAAEEMFDDVLPESIDDRFDEVTDNLPESVDDVLSREVDVNDDVNDDVNGGVSVEIFDDNSRESHESRESREDSNEINSSEKGPLAAFMDMVEEFKGDNDDSRDMDSMSNDVSDEVKGNAQYKTVMRQIGGQLRSMGLHADAERVVDAYDHLLDLGDDREHGDDSYDHLLDDSSESRERDDDSYDHLLDDSSESRERDDDSYDHLLDDVNQLFGDDDANDGLLEMAYTGKHNMPKYAARQGYYAHQGMNGGYSSNANSRNAYSRNANSRNAYSRNDYSHNAYSRNANMMNMVQANMAHAKAANTGTCPLYPVNIDEDKVTITTQGGCKIVIKLKGASVESVHTDGDNLTERERVARSVEVSYGSEKRED